MDWSASAPVLIGLLLAAWTLGALVLALRASTRMRAAEGHRKAARKLTRMLDEAPAIPLLVRADGRIEAPERLAHWLALDNVPRFLSELAPGGDKGLDPAQLDDLTDAVRRTQKSAEPFRMTLRPPGSQRSLAARGMLADPQVQPGGAALVWLFDFSESEEELSRLRGQAEQAQGDFTALSGLIEAAPMPMWFRGLDGKLRLVNSAYVRAVEGEGAEEIVASQQELVEPVEGRSAADVARQAMASDRPIERTIAATIAGQRRTLRVSDLPLGDEGVAGYAVDVEEMEEQAREFRAFREAQRTMLDQFSQGVAQFDAARRLYFANHAFRRIFALPQGALNDPPGFDRLLDLAREQGRVPEVRDFPQWRRERGDWFGASEPVEENWPLGDGTHLRVVSIPMPDGGMVMVAEDRTEQLALSATRDTLLRTRTATFDSLFESLAAFAPDGRLQLWNRRFVTDWALEESFLDTHPRAEALIERLGRKLAKPEEAEEIGRIVRAATLDRSQKAGRVALRDGRTFELAGVPLPDGNGLLTVLDVTDSQRAEDALRERAEALEEADAVKTKFLANMSYEFRTPLTSIGGFAELLASGAAGELSGAGREYADAILQSVGRLTEQIETVLDLSQSEAGLMELARERIELVPLVIEVAKAREEEIAAADIDCDLRASRRTGEVEVDGKQLSRALGHVLDNAIAGASEAKGKGRIVIDLSRGRDGVRIVVTDNGPGMDEVELRRALGKGTGRREQLGLPLARQLVESHGGSFDLMSEKGGGTAAVILLP